MLGLFKPKWPQLSIGYIYFTQSLVAHSQWAMEQWNDALAIAADEFDPGNETLIRGRASLSNPELIERELLPAAHAQYSTAVIMRTRIGLRRKLPKRSPEELERLAKAAGGWVAAYAKKASHRVMVLKEAVADPGVLGERDLSAFDDAETYAMLEVTDALLGLKASLHVTDEMWLAIAFGAFNEHRVFRNLAPMLESEFIAAMSSGLAGARPRYFAP